jgi:dienelactone hydrolase
VKTHILFLTPLLLANASLALGADVQTDFWYPSTVTTDANGPLKLLAELNYDDARTKAPIAVVMHGFSPAAGTLREVRPNAQHLRDNGFFAISVAMRNRDGSGGIRDSGGVEIHDIHDAVEAVKADPALAGYIDPTNVHITGYSGGGGNVMSALTKFPDYFRVGAGYFGMSDYGYDLTHGWYNNGAGGRTSRLRTDIGDPNAGDLAVLDRYLARASNRASKNNPYSEIHLFVNANEKICPPINSTSYRDNAIAAQSKPGEFDNITVHIGGLGAFQDFNNDSVKDSNEGQSWPHGFPKAHHQDAAELWYRDRLLAGAIPQPVINDADEFFVAGYVVTSKFKCWLGDGQNAAGNLTYSLSDTAMSFNLSLQTSDLTKTGNLTIDTARMAGRKITVTLNDTPVTTLTGGGTYNYPDLGHNQTLALTVNGPSANEPPTNHPPSPSSPQ